jgi:hypothetical protein
VSVTVKVCETFDIDVKRFAFGEVTATCPHCGVEVTSDHYLSYPTVGAWETFHMHHEIEVPNPDDREFPDFIEHEFHVELKLSISIEAREPR